MQENHVCQPYLHGVGLVEVNYQKRKCLARYYRKCPDLHKMSRFQLPPYGGGVEQVPKIFFARNYMKCADLCRKVIFATPTHVLRLGSCTRRFLCYDLNEMYKSALEKLCLGWYREQGQFKKNKIFC